MQDKTVGRFTFHGADSTISGPAAYMKAQGNARLAQIERGGSVADQMIIERAPDVVTGILVVLQTDYAAYAGYEQMFGKAPR